MSWYDAKDKYGNEHLLVLGLAWLGALFRLPSILPSPTTYLHLGSPQSYQARATARKRTVARPVTASYEREKVHPILHRPLASAPEVEPLDSVLTTTSLFRPGHPLFGSTALNESLKSAYFTHTCRCSVARDGVLTLFFPVCRQQSGRLRALGELYLDICGVSGESCTLRAERSQGLTRLRKLDSIKSRLQTTRQRVSIPRLALAVYQEEGIVGFYRGIWIPLMTISFVRTSCLYCFHGVLRAHRVP